MWKRSRGSIDATPSPSHPTTGPPRSHTVTARLTTQQFTERADQLSSNADHPLWDKMLGDRTGYHAFVSGWSFLSSHLEPALTAYSGKQSRQEALSDCYDLILGRTGYGGSPEVSAMTPNAARVLDAMIDAIGNGYLQGTEHANQRRAMWRPLVGQVALAYKKDDRGSISGLELGSDATKYLTSLGIHAAKIAGKREARSVDKKT